LKITKPSLSFLKCVYYGGMLDTTIKFTKRFLAQTMNTKVRQDVKNFGAGICKHHAKFWGSHNSVSEDSDLRGCDTVSGGKWLHTFWKIVVRSASEIKQTKKNSVSSQTAWPLKVKAAQSFEMSRTQQNTTPNDTAWHHRRLKPHTHTHNITLILALHIWHVSVTYENGEQSYLPLHCILSMSRQCRSLCRVLPLRPPNTKTCKHTILSVPATIPLLRPPVYH
jgi:hypothetical protein